MKSSKIKKIILLGVIIRILIILIVAFILLFNICEKNNNVKIINKNNNIVKIINENNNNVQKMNLLKGSNITNGWGGAIFQDEFKNLWSIGDRTSLQVLKANQNQNGYVTTGWNNVNNGNGLLKGLNINEGYGATIFQDSFKNLWLKGTNSNLQVLRVNSQKNGYDETTSWKSNVNSRLLLNSNIKSTANWSGKIFQDSFKNLWTMGRNFNLQVLKANKNQNGYVTTGWDSNNSNLASGLLKGSNINNGRDGIIFQDSFKNLWTMGEKTKLQVLRANRSKKDYVTTGWTSDTNIGLTKNSNITNGRYGTIFQDEFKNLWAMGRYTKLQVLRANENKDGYDKNSGWTSVNNNELLKGSNINQGQGGTIFQDDFKNLWATGFQDINFINKVWKVVYPKLQVLRVKKDKNGYVKTGWDNDNSDSATGLLKNSNIFDGNGATIFQDSFKNLWAMSDSITKDVNGVKKTIHTKLQVLKANQNKDGYVTTGWTNDNGHNGEPLLKNSNIINGKNGIIFQDEFKNLWAMSRNSNLQVLRANQNKDGYVDSWQKLNH